MVDGALLQSRAAGTRSRSVVRTACLILSVGALPLLLGCRSNAGGVDITNRSRWAVRLRITDIGIGTGVTTRRPARTLAHNATFAEVFDSFDSSLVERQYMLDVPTETRAGMVVLRAKRGRIVRRDIVSKDDRLLDAPAKTGPSQMFTHALDALKRGKQERTHAQGIEPEIEQ